MTSISKLIVLFLIAAVLPAAARAQTTVPAGPQTRRDVVAMKLAFNQRTLAGEYARVGRRDPKWDAAAAEMLDGFARYVSGGDEQIWYAIDHPTPDRLRAQCERLTGELGCDDPLVLYCGAKFASEQARGPDERRAAETREVRAYQTLRDSGYDALRKGFAAKRVARLSGVADSPWRDSPEVARAATDAVAFDAACFTGDAFLPGEERVLLELVWKPLSTKPVAETRAFVEAIGKGDAHEWARLVVAGDVAVTAAWEARGGGFADAVTPEGWKGFGERLIAAAEAYGRADALHPERPEAAAGMIPVALGEQAPPGTDAAWRDIAASLPADDPARVYAEATLRAKAFARTLAAAAPGAWVDVPADLSYWEAVEGQWTAGCTAGCTAG